MKGSSSHLISHLQHLQPPPTTSNPNSNQLQKPNKLRLHGVLHFHKHNLIEVIAQLDRISIIADLVGDPLADLVVIDALASRLLQILVNTFEPGGAEACLNSCFVVLDSQPFGLDGVEAVHAGAHFGAFGDGAH